MKCQLHNSILCFGAILVASSGTPVAAEQQAPVEKPNIIFILADDVGQDCIGCYGSDSYKTQTPNIDALAKAGLRFENCYASPMCAPTRGVFLTGRYVFRAGGHSNAPGNKGNPGAKSKDGPPIARLLKENGYATCQVGKWRQVSKTPKDWGFDEYCTDNAANGWYWRNSYLQNGEQVQTDKQVYCPDVAHEFAMDFINRHKDQPFFVYYAQHLVHLPMERTPDSKPGTTNAKALYADNLAYMDKQVGLVVQELNRLKLRERTLIIFAGDNGTTPEFADTINGRAINGHKGDLLEGGSRVPLIANWPGVTPEGKVLNDLIDFSDMYVTFADVAGVKLPKDVIFDGHSFAPQLRGLVGNPREWVYVQFRNNWYVRSQGWKLTQNGDLFDMKEAPFVEKPIAADTQDPQAIAARDKLKQVLGTLDPSAGKSNNSPTE